MMDSRPSFTASIRYSQKPRAGGVQVGGIGWLAYCINPRRHGIAIALDKIIAIHATLHHAITQDSQEKAKALNPAVTDGFF
jgi:hypothetical protein